MNPMDVAKARTARLAAEAVRPVYTSETKPVERAHVTMVEFEDDYHRSWSGPYFSVEQQRDAIDEMESIGYWVSDIDCSVKCWCA